MIGRREFITLLGGSDNQIVSSLAALARTCMKNAVYPHPDTETA
jgi:hypothetical protein